MKLQIDAREWITSRMAVLIAMLALVPVLLSAFARPVQADASLFASVPEPNGVAFRPGNAPGKGILVTTPFNCDGPREVVSFNSSGTQTGVSLLPDQVNCPAEDYIAVSPAGLPAWPANRVYVVQRNHIYEGTGSPLVFSSTPFVTLPSACDVPDAHPGITFDTVGTFDHQMIVTCADFGSGTSTVYKVGPFASPTATLIATIDDAVEGPNVAPLSFGASGGCIFVASEGSGNIYAVCPGVSVFSNWPGAEAVRFIPSRNGQPPCEFNPEGGAFFQADFSTGSILQWPAEDFAGLAGNALVPSETGAGHGVLTPSGSISPFAATDGLSHEGSTFINFSVGCQ